MNKDLIVDLNPKSIISESIRMIRTNIQFLNKEKKNNKSNLIYVTSSVAGEGKSFVSSNLAISFAQLNKKTLIVDCDLRKGRLHNVFGLSNNNGLSKILTENEISNVKEYILKTNIENLSVLTRGSIPGNPSELLNSKCVDVLLESLGDKYDYIILDGVPTVGLSDSLIMAKKVDGVVVVTSLRTTTSDTFYETGKLLKSVKANVLGVVVNKVPKTNKKYYKYE